MMPMHWINPVYWTIKQLNHSSISNIRPNDNYFFKTFLFDTSVRRRRRSFVVHHKARGLNISRTVWHRTAKLYTDSYTDLVYNLTGHDVISCFRLEVIAPKKLSKRPPPWTHDQISWEQCKWGSPNFRRNRNHSFNDFKNRSVFAPIFRTVKKENIMENDHWRKKNKQYRKKTWTAGNPWRRVIAYVKIIKQSNWKSTSCHDKINYHC